MIRRSLSPHRRVFLSFWACGINGTTQVQQVSFAASAMIAPAWDEIRLWQVVRGRHWATLWSALVWASVFHC